jgi:DNA-binding HxlR family transcriptional regulator
MLRSKGFRATDTVTCSTANARAGSSSTASTSRWAPLILVKLAEGPLRFYELRDHIGGISEKVLSEKLRLLTRDGLVERTVEPAIPPRVSYALTDTGHSLAKPLRQLMRWVADHGEAIMATQARHDDQN